MAGTNRRKDGGGAKKKPEKKTAPKEPVDEIKTLKTERDKVIKSFEEMRNGRRCYAFLGQEINGDVVDDVFGELRESFADCDGHLDVIVDSGGGMIDAAYNLAMLFRKYGHEELNFFVPRWAKSAATLLVCSGDTVFMSQVAELGPLDPQITQMNPMEGRFEHFSPLHIKSTLDLIRDEFENGNENLAEGLMQRLQFPLTLGSFIKYHEIGEQYMVKLLETRMNKNNHLTATPREIAERLTKGYADHGFCINIDEAKSIGLNAVEIPENELDVLWKVHGFNRKITRLEKELREKKMRDMIKEIPPGLLDKLPQNLQKDLRDGLIPGAKNGAGGGHS